MSRVAREATGKYGFKMEFTTATVDTMRDLLTELSRRYFVYITTEPAFLEEYSVLDTV